MKIVFFLPAGMVEWAVPPDAQANFVFGQLVKNIRADAGLTGTGLSGAKWTTKYLAAASASDPAYKGLPRDLRARQYAIDNYGADPALVDAVAPISGFLSKAMSRMRVRWISASAHTETIVASEISWWRNRPPNRLC